MGCSILSRRDRIELENGMSLRLLSALEVMQARRAASLLAEEERERALSEMRRLNDSIKDETISAQIDRLEETTRKILSYVLEHPDENERAHLLSLWQARQNCHTGPEN